MTQATAIDFKELIQGDRAQSEKRHFKGNFLEYLELVRQDLRIPELAHARLYNIVTGPGFRVLNTAIVDLDSPPATWTPSVAGGRLLIGPDQFLAAPILFWPSHLVWYMLPGNDVRSF